MCTLQGRLQAQIVVPNIVEQDRELFGSEIGDKERRLPNFEGPCSYVSFGCPVGCNVRFQSRRLNGSVGYCECHTIHGLIPLRGVH